MAFSFFRKKSNYNETDNLPERTEIESGSLEMNEEADSCLTAREEAYMDMFHTNANLRLQEVQSTTTVCNNILCTANNLINIYGISKRVEQNIAQLECATNVQLANISARFQLQQQALQGIFGQRQQGLSKQFDVLDKAMQQGDRELIIESLRGISTIVTSSPLEDFEKLCNAWENNAEPLELGF